MVNIGDIEWSENLNFTHFYILTLSKPILITNGRVIGSYLVIDFEYDSVAINLVFEEEFDLETEYNVI